MMNKYASEVSDEKVNSFPIAVIVSLFNPSITQPLQDGAIEHLRQRGFSEGHINLFQVPGAIDIPYIARLVAAKKKFESIIVLGSIIHGESNHYDWVGAQVCQNCDQISKEFNIPVIFGILTTEHAAQAQEALGGRFGHKGVNCVEYAIAVQNLKEQINAI